MVSEERGVEGQRKEVNVESYFGQGKNPNSDILSSVRLIEDRQYQNVSDVTKAAGLVY
jgi:hypothetical protein